MRSVTELAIHPRRMVYADPASQILAKLLDRIAPTDVPVVIRGDTGTGKEVVARHIHEISGRSGTLVCVNCSALADQQPRRELISGAEFNAAGVSPHGERWFGAARHGTLVLDEIAALPPSLQGELLRLLQQQEASHAVTHAPGTTEVRVVATTRVDLREAVSAGHFHLELFYRLNVGQVGLLPLQQRCGDVPALTTHFLRLYAGQMRLPAPRLGEQALDALTRYSWPGNVRELENVIRFALLVSAGSELRVEHLKLGDIAGSPVPAQPVQASAVALNKPAGKEPLADCLSQVLPPLFQRPGASLLDDLQQQIVAEAFRFTGRNQVRTAELLGVSRNVLRTLLRKHGLLVVRQWKTRGGIQRERSPKNQ